MYKPSWILGAIIAALCLLALPGRVFAAETIRDFSVSATISSDRLLDVTESITYDFGDAQHHGIVRDIPVVYVRNNSSYALHLAVKKVTRDGVAEPFSTSEAANVLELRIGDPNQTTTGAHRYQLEYQTDRAINFFADHSELYWNVTGNMWQIPIEQSSFDLTLPPDILLGAVSSTCFTGSFGSTISDCAISSTTSGFHVATNRVLLPDEGLTVVFGFPPGAIAAPTTTEKLLQFITDNLVVIYPILALIAMWMIWVRKGRDPRRQTVIPEYEPPRKLSPALVAAAATESGVPREAVTATIIDLARRGYLKIRFGEKTKIFGTEQTFTFVRQKQSDGGLSTAETDVLDGLFSSGDEVKLSDLQKQKFYLSVFAFQRHVTEKVTEMKVFTANPTLVRGGYLAAAIVTGIVLNFFSSTLFDSFCFILTGVVIAVFGWFMPKRTADGVALLAEIDGFKWFLSVTERDRLAFTDAPQRTPEQFQEFLPYAIVFGVEKKWAAQFANISVPAPEWAEGDVSNMNAAMLATNLSQMSAMSTTAFSSPSSAGSGGSGFSGGGSGGGFGGGGGGSW